MATTASTHHGPVAPNSMGIITPPSSPPAPSASASALAPSASQPLSAIPAPTASEDTSGSGSPAMEKRHSSGGGTNGASRYPSPPLVVDAASLYIPPYNPANAKRRSQQGGQGGVSGPGGVSGQGGVMGQGGQGGQGGAPGPGQGGQGMAQTLGAELAQTQAHGGLPAAGSGHREAKHRPASAAVVPVPQAYSPAPARAERGGGSATAQRTRASHHVQSSTGGGYDNGGAGAGAYAAPLNMIGVNHPMPRQRIYFGPYLLLQTLGEGEFGKVKLGVHSAPDRWGEEVAIKLIKRGNVDTQARMVKVAREIDVLKLVHHPNIVRLYDVIETEKYIGIVLEYASGGELFDHILAHRYLKEKDASKLFAQLISGVQYLHNKGIVHRDLKLENLLLDRHRNVIITDFGFANRFADHTSDLMATSCGSPCYAAPELVVQDGRYVGSAVDVWSCGVILYAMLAGYLPFDDDPANPDGDNINLLYKYIINTPLSFPDWITAEPRDLLLRMLVPDPAKRCTLDDVARHPWLARCAHLFERSVDELETAARDAEQNKRLSLQRQRHLIAQQQQQEQQQQAMARSHSASGGRVLGNASGGRGHQSAMVTSATSDQLYATNGAGAGDGRRNSGAYHQQVAAQQQRQPRQGGYPVVAAQQPGGRAGGRAQSSVVVPTTQVQHLHTSADAFSYGPTAQHVQSSMPMVPSVSAPGRGPEGEREDVVMTDVPAPVAEQTVAGTTSGDAARALNEFGAPQQGQAANAATTSSAKKRKAAARHTVQVEYAPRAGTVGGRNGAYRGREAKQAPATPAIDEDVVMMQPQPEAVSEPATSFETARQTVSGGDAEEPVPVPGVAQMSPVQEDEPVETGPAPVPSTPRAGSRVGEEKVVTPTASRVHATPRVEVNLATPSRTEGRARAPKTSDGTTVTSSGTSLAFPGEQGKEQQQAQAQAQVQKRQRPSTSGVPKPAIPERVESRSSNVSVTSTSSAEARRAARHRKGLSTDRFFSRLLGSPASTESPGKAGTPKKEVPAAPAGAVPAEERRKARRKALSLVVEPLNKAGTDSPKGRKSRAGEPAGTPTGATPPAMTTVEKRRSRLSSAALAAVSAQTPSRPVTRSPTANKLNGNGNLAPPPVATKTSSSNASSWASSAQSSSGQSATNNSKAKRVMEWFRFKSLNEAGGQQPAPIATDFDRRSRRESTSLLSKRPSTATAASARAPAVVVTGTPTGVAPADGARAGEKGASDGESAYPSSRSASGTTTLTASTVATTVSTGSKTAVPTKPSRTVTTFAKPADPAPFNDSKLKLHHGAIDQNALSGKLPPLLMKDVRRVLWEMGIDVVEESTMKLKATRRSRKKVAASLGLGISALEQHQRSGGMMPSFSQQSSPLVGADRSPHLSASVGSSSGGHGGLTPSPSSTFRSLFQRKGSSQSVTNLAASSAPAAPSPALSLSTSSHGHGGAQVDEAGMLMSPQPTATQGQPLPAYGDDPSMDSGDDVRFTVEITRMKGFDKLYAVDIKRLRGSLWSFKYLYLQILEKLDLSTKA